jgi:hypothetical protein
VISCALSFINCNALTKKVKPWNSSAQIALGERGQFRRRQDGFNFHFASREGREGGEENLQAIYTLVA